MKLGICTDSGYARGLKRVAAVADCPLARTINKPLSCGNYSSSSEGLLTVRDMAHVGYLGNGPNGV